VQSGSHIDVFGDESTRQHQQIVELDGAFGSAGHGSVERGAAEHRAEDPNSAIAHVGEEIPGSIGERQFALAQVVERVGSQPGRLPFVAIAELSAS
jgi:hypothetical protein